MNTERQSADSAGNLDAEAISGSCHCGLVRFSFSRKAAGVLACHCADCHKMHGNFNAFLAVSADEVEMTGKESLTWYQSSKISRRAFCSVCGGRVLKEMTEAGRWLLSAGLIDGDTGRHNIRNLWEQSKPDWYDMPVANP